MILDVLEFIYGGSDSMEIEFSVVDIKSVSGIIKTL